MRKYDCIHYDDCLERYKNYILECNFCKKCGQYEKSDGYSFFEGYSGCYNLLRAVFYPEKYEHI